MKGKFLHNQLILQPLATALALKGYEVFEELPVTPGQRPQSVDLAFRAHGHLMLIECEQCPARVGNDTSKAERIGADLLSIVVPNAHTRSRVQAALERLKADSGERRAHIQVVTLGTALNWIANNCPLPPRSSPHHRKPTSFNKERTPS